MNPLSSRPWWLAAPALALGALLASCSSKPADDSSQTAVVTVPDKTAPVTATAPDSSQGAASAAKPTGTKPAWGPDIKPEMQAVIEQLASFKAPDLTTLSAKEARKQPGAKEAADKEMRIAGIPTPPLNCDTVTKTLVPGVKARIYTPKSGTAPYPVIVYYHGGGWVIANLDTYGPSAQALCEKTGSVVVSVAYRQAPEHKFPTAHDDSFAAYQWTLKNASSIKGNQANVAVVGESAGGNLACAVSMLARDKKVALPKYQVLVYPIAGYDQNTPSYQKNTMTKPLNKPLMAWFFKNYLRTPADGQDPRINLVAANLKGLPPTTIIGAELDPLMSEGKTLADNLKAVGVKVNYKLYDGVTHEFFGMAAVVPQAKEAQDVATDDLKAAMK